MGNWFNKIVNTTGYNPFSAKAAIAKAASPLVEEGIVDLNTGINAVVHNDPKAREELKKYHETAGKIAGISLAAASTAGTALTYGIWPTIASEVSSMAGGYALGKVGEKIDEKYDTQWVAPLLTTVGGVVSGVGGWKGAIKATGTGKVNPKLVTKEFVKEQVAPDMMNTQVAKTKLPQQALPYNVGWAPAQTSTWYHHSNTPVTEFKVPFKERWDVVNHGADPNLIWLTKENGTAGMMAERPYHQQFSVILKKPMVQVGEVPTIPGQKNTSRNAIVARARDAGADAVIFDGIADNKLKGQQVVAVMGDKTTPTHIKDPKVLFSTGRGIADVDFEDIAKYREYLEQHGVPSKSIDQWLTDAANGGDWGKREYENWVNRPLFSDFDYPKATPQSARSRAANLIWHPSYLQRWTSRYPGNYGNIIGKKLTGMTNKVIEVPISTDKLGNYPGKRGAYFKPFDRIYYNPDLARDLDLTEELIHSTDDYIYITVPKTDQKININAHLYTFPEDANSELRFPSEQRAKSLIGVYDMIERGLNPNNPQHVTDYLQSEKLPKAVKMLQEQFDPEQVKKMLLNMKTLIPTAGVAGVSATQSKEK